MADDHDVDVGLLLSHPGYLDNQPERSSNVEEKEVKRECCKFYVQRKIGLSQPSTWGGAGAMAAGGESGRSRSNRV